MANFATSTFSSGSTITGNTPELGGTWSAHANSSGSELVISSGKVTQGGTSGNTRYVISATPPSADYSVTADITIGGTSDVLLGVLGRTQSGDYGYSAALHEEVGGLSIFEFAGSGPVVIATCYFPSYTMPAGTYKVILEMSGSTLNAYCQRKSDDQWLTNLTWGGTKAVGATSSDASTSAAGNAGIWISCNSGSTGTIDNFAAFTGAEDGGGTPAGAAMAYYAQL
jgi:hypothetical protein